MKRWHCALIFYKILKKNYRLLTTEIRNYETFVSYGLRCYGQNPEHGSIPTFSPEDFCTGFLGDGSTESNEILTVNAKSMKRCHCALVFYKMLNKNYRLLTTEVRNYETFVCNIFTMLRAKSRARWQR